MNRKTVGVLVVVGLIVLALGGFMMTRRMSRMHGGSGRAAGGLLAVSPDGKQVPPPADGAPLPENTAAQVLDGLAVSLAMEPYPPTSYKETNFKVTLIDQNGQQVDDATVILDLTMPEMWMPPNSLSLPPAGGGLYQGTGRFTMRGWWRIEAIIERNGQKQSAFFDVWL
jgi:hypothetical protein